MVVDALAYHPAIGHYLRFIATTAGRDKVLRTLQYFSRFYAWYLYRTNHPPPSLAPWLAIKAHFGLARKLLRLGKNVEHARAAALAARNKSAPPALRALAVGRQLGYAVYLTLDGVGYLHAAGIRKTGDAKRVGVLAARAWFGGLACSVAAGAYSLVALRRREGGVDRKEGEGVVEAKKIERERAAILTQLVSDLADIVNPATTIGLANFDDGFIGLAGVLSSLIGLRAAWKKTA